MSKTLSLPTLHQMAGIKQDRQLFNKDDFEEYLAHCSAAQLIAFNNPELALIPSNLDTNFTSEQIDQLLSFAELTEEEKQRLKVNKFEKIRAFFKCCMYYLAAV